jgi:hypothetical protein
MSAWVKEIAPQYDFVSKPHAAITSMIPPPVDETYPLRTDPAAKQQSISNRISEVLGYSRVANKSSHKRQGSDVVSECLAELELSQRSQGRGGFSLTHKEPAPSHYLPESVHGHHSRLSKALSDQSIAPGTTLPSLQ